MEQFTQQMESLHKESKELIDQCLLSIIVLVKDQSKPCEHVALVIARRFSEERIATSFPAVCLVDAMVQLVGNHYNNNSNSNNSSGRGSGAEEASTDAKAVSFVLKELWPLVTPLFEHYRGQPAALKEKVVRIVRRWQQRKRVEDDITEALLRNIETKETTTEVADATTREVQSTKNKKKEGEEQGGGAEEENMRKNLERFAFQNYTQGQVEAYRGILCSCVSLIEELPPDRAAKYAELILREKLSGPTVAAMEILRNIHAELRRELTAVQRVANTTSHGEHGVEGQEESGEEARAALGKLLNHLQASNFNADASLSGSSTSNYTVHYRHPLFNDVAQSNSVGQRRGFGALAPHPLSSASGEHYYPKRSGERRQLFRVPARMSSEGSVAVRRPFPSPEEWLETKDVSSLALFESRPSGSHKRPRGE